MCCDMCVARYSRKGGRHALCGPATGRGGLGQAAAAVLLPSITRAAAARVRCASAMRMLLPLAACQAGLRRLLPAAAHAKKRTTKPP